jgi:hypothetical protein
MPTILDAYEIPWRMLGERALDDDVAWAREQFDETRRPVALVVPPGVFA